MSRNNVLPFIPSDAYRPLPRIKHPLAQRSEHKGGKRQNRASVNAGKCGKCSWAVQEAAGALKGDRDRSGGLAKEECERKEEMGVERGKALWVCNEKAVSNNPPLSLAASLAI
jgi:hypothetical protein